MVSMMRLAVLLLLLVAPASRAAESTVLTTPRDRVSVISLSDSVAAGGKALLGLRLRLAPGWHTYWSNPGDAGAPPAIEVTGAVAGPLVFPVPERLREGPFTSYAYTGEVVLPFDVTSKGGTPSDPKAGNLSLDVHATWLVCAEVCVPEEARFHLNLPKGDGAPGPQAPLFATAKARMPRSSPFAAHVSPHGVLFLDAPGLSLRDALFFPDAAGLIDQGAPQVLTVRPGRVELALKTLKPELGALAGVLVLTDTSGQTQALSVQATPAPLPEAPADLSKPEAAPADLSEHKAAPAGLPGLGRVLLLAFAGGLILNLMPCVLPVLAIKALALARLSGSARGHVRREAAAYTLGVVTAFCAIGAATLGARALGGAAGWGVQFQSVAFTSGMAMLLLAVGLNFSGVFEVGGRVAGLGQGLAARGSFFTGLLAVLVATPCTAPFMGAALAAALALPAAAGMLVFVALGLGLAAPYAALALTPGVASLLPRPGAWMEVFRRLLAFPMYAAALWMVWVASQQTDAVGLAAVFACVLLTGFAAWAFGAGQARERAGLLGASSLAALLGVAVLLAGLGWAPSGAHASAGKASDGSEPFSPARLASLLAAHRPVFVDMSAAWCVTCLVNERLALAPRAVREAFARQGVTYLKGDWTRRDPGITAFLSAHDRSGVPLYVFYPPQGAPVTLPQILSPSLVLDTLR